MDENIREGFEKIAGEPAQTNNIQEHSHNNEMNGPVAADYRNQTGQTSPGEQAGQEAQVVQPPQVPQDAGPQEFLQPQVVESPVTPQQAMAQSPLQQQNSQGYQPVQIQELPPQPQTAPQPAASQQPAHNQNTYQYTVQTEGYPNTAVSPAPPLNASQQTTSGGFYNQSETSEQGFTMRDAGGPIVKQETPVKKPSKNKARIVAVVLLVVIAFGAGFGGGIAASYYVPSGNAATVTGNNNAIVINPDSTLDTAEAIAAKVIPSVVGISTTSEYTYQGWFGTQRGVSQGAGTGLIVDEKGFILTNSHVIDDGKASEILVQLSDGRDASGEILWYDTMLDLAIVKIEMDGLEAADLGNSDDVRIGAYAVAIGNPLGNFQWSLTQGVISGLDRTITISAGTGTQASTMEGLMQTDASINSGNSGGPLLNSSGEVIGINTAKVQSGEGLGFAIPINIAKPIVEQIKETGEYNRVFIGISGVSAEIFLSYFPETDLGTEEGVYITAITPDGGAEAAGLLVGDVIIGVEGDEIKTMEALTRRIIMHRPGDTVTLTIMRHGTEMEVDVTLK